MHPYDLHKERRLFLLHLTLGGGGSSADTLSIPIGHLDSTSTATVMTAQVDGITELRDGVCMLLKNGVVTSARGFTLNINGLGAKPVYSNMAAATRETTIFNVNYTLLLIYDSTRVDGGCWINYRGYYSDANTVPTGYCTTAAGTAAKSAACTYGYRDDDNYFPCVFRYANTATNATLAISSYATTAAPIYVNGARTSSSNTFGCGVILFLYHNGAYYCYNDGRFPIVVDGAVTSVQEYVATIGVGGSGLLITVSGSASEGYTLDKTGREIIDAVNAGIAPVFKRIEGSSTSIYPFTNMVYNTAGGFAIGSAGWSTSFRATSFDDYPSIAPQGGGGSND